MDADAVAAAFAAAMARAAPFEPAPHLAVALSGGADSTALLGLADAWARARGGRVTALTVDHRLRAESAAEAARVAASCMARGIEHATLVREGVKPASGIQAAARLARYRLLERWCRDAGVLHLLVAHHADDQRETQALRASRGSGEDGRAGMAAVVERRDLRILRPLLAVPGAALRCRLARLGESWIEDPSNADPRFARVRLRRAGAMPAADPVAGVSRALRERRLAGFLARHAAVHEEGWVALDEAPLLAAPAEFAAAALGRALAAVGGRDHPPRARELSGLVDALAGGARRCTLGGCRIERARGRIDVVREAAAIEAPMAVDPDGAAFWDGRFEIRGAAAANSVGALGACGSAAPISARATLRRTPLPRAALAALPALRDLDGSPTVPHLFCGRLGGGLDTVGAVIVAFRPPRPLAGAPFAPAAQEPGEEAPGTAGPTIEDGAQPLAKPDAA